LGYVDDGYNEDGYIEAVAGMYPALRFKFRRMVDSEREAHQRELAKIAGVSVRQLGNLSQADVRRMNPSAVRKLGCQTIVGHVSSWDLRDANGCILPVTSELAWKLKDDLLGNLVAIVGSLRASDVDPEWDDKADEARAASGELSPGELEEIRAKNL